DNPSDPELLYLQADTWFQQAESHYKKENYKTANDLYKQVLGIWPNHPILNERISFLSKKNLTDNNQKKEESVIQNPLANHSNINETYIVVNEDISLFKIVSYNQEQDLWKSELSFPMKNPGYSIITLKASEKEKLILLKPIAFGILILSVILTTLSVNLILLAMKTKKSSKGIWSKKKGNT
ncbi:MAG TPA: hypothetical protein PLS71_04900, partial [Leptospiraceae bacterium]|nr:hypothetical protein [Leptospiraceae bacterium]